jgi:MoaA/NifB/PqqE/SkfB family radical SAM enzyme
MKDRFYFTIDILAACNLRCPSCPVGNYESDRWKGSTMSPDLLRRILRKATGECSITGVALYNWAEPLLHPQLPEMIRIVHDFGILCDLSSNLNLLKNPREILREDPNSIVISLSGFNQEMYARTHVNGDIARVKENMLHLVAAKRETAANTNIYIRYHRYRDNLQDEIQMRDFARDHGIGFQPVWAYFMPLEKNLAYLGAADNEVALTEKDHQLIKMLALPLREGSTVARQHRQQPCLLREEQVTIDFEGNVMLCCGVYDRDKYGFGSYLDIPIERLQKKRRSHPMCNSCMEQGMHVYGTYGTGELDAIAVKNVKPDEALKLNIIRDGRRMRLKSRLSRIGHRLVGPRATAWLGVRYDRLMSLFPSG